MMMIVEGDSHSEGRGGVGGRKGHKELNKNKNKLPVGGGGGSLPQKRQAKTGETGQEVSLSQSTLAPSSYLVRVGWAPKHLGTEQGRSTWQGGQGPR